MSERTKRLCLCALFSALIAVGAFIKIPGPLVPFTVQFLFANLSGILLGKKWGAAAVGLYVALGLIGVPVFTAGGGFQYVLQPTFGYLLGFTVGAFVAGWIVEKRKKKNFPTFLLAGFANMAVFYALGVAYGTVILKVYLQSDIAFYTVLLKFCVVFLPTDLIWAFIASGLSVKLYPFVNPVDAIELKVKKVLRGKALTVDEIYGLARADLARLTAGADRITRATFGENYEPCAIVNAKCGQCSEDCTYCAQSTRNRLPVAGHPMMTAETLAEKYRLAKVRGAVRCGAVSAGARISQKDIDTLCKAAEIAKEGAPKLCVSGGLLTKEDFLRLKEGGYTRVHCNLETSEKHFPKICTTHAYQQKRDTLQAVKDAEMELCSGGIIGVGEKRRDRIALALELRKWSPNSVPINILHPIEGTPLEGQTPLSYDEIKRTFALFRFILPKADIRLAGGVDTLEDGGAALLHCGANGAIVGSLLTTEGMAKETLNQD